MDEDYVMAGTPSHRLKAKATVSRDLHHLRSTLTPINHVRGIPELASHLDVILPHILNPVTCAHAYVRTGMCMCVPNALI